jgi:hypothetical protein
VWADTRKLSGAQRRPPLRSRRNRVLFNLLYLTVTTGRPATARQPYIDTATSGMVAPVPIETTIRAKSRRLLRQPTLFVAVPVIVFVLHALLFRRWLMDDAGISFAYARNLAAGHGLVSQPGAPPVEGYSNFLWVLLMAIFYRIGLFHVLWTPKIIACALTAGSFLVVNDTLRRATSWGPGIAVSGLTLVALQPAFVIWSISGLENPLYVFLLSLLLAGVVDLVLATDPSRTTLISTAVITAGIAATRPDGIIYTAVVPLILAVRACVARRLRPWLGALIVYGVVATVLLGALVGFRWWYFHDIFPNTYYMKAAGRMEGTVESLLLLHSDTVTKIRDLSEAIAGVGRAKWPVIIVLVGTVFALCTRRFPPILAVLALFSVFSGLPYLLLPKDFMGEYRFATPFFLFFYTYVVALAWSVCSTLGAAAVKRLAFAIVVGLVVVGTLVQVSKRSVTFASYPATPLARIAEYFGHRYNRLAESFKLDSPTLMTVNQGGALLYSNLRVVDLGGLCDRTIARTIGRDQKAFYDYVFEQVRPTFIELHTVWIKIAALDADPRFQRDYVPIKERIVDENGVPRLQSGDYIRRDVLRGPVEPLASILGPNSPCCQPVVTPDHP